MDILLLFCEIDDFCKVSRYEEALSHNAEAHTK
jgi:hypothetical protein